MKTIHFTRIRRIYSHMTVTALGAWSVFFCSKALAPSAICFAIELDWFIESILGRCDEAAPDEGKKRPAWSDTLKCSTTPAYSLTSLPQMRVALHLVIRQIQTQQ
jgi:hypothetical protein